MSDEKARKAEREASRKAILNGRKPMELEPDELMRLAQLDDDDHEDELRGRGVINSRTTTAEVQRMLRG